MHLDLIADQRLVCKLHRLFDEGNGKVGYSDVAGETRALDFAQRAERVAQRNVRIGPMQQEQVDFGEPQSRQALLRGTLEIVRSKMRRPDLGGDEDLVTSDIGGAQSFSHLAFVVVKLGGIDVAIAELQRLLYDTRTGAPAQLPGAEPNEGNAGAVRFDNVGRYRHHHLTSAGLARFVGDTTCDTRLRQD